MCLIIYKPQAKLNVPNFFIQNARVTNPDGFGIVFLDDGEMIKTADYTYAESLLGQERPYVAHFRYATQGAINELNMHPAPFSKGWLFSNGTVPTLGTKKKSDTRVVAGYLEKTPKRYWADMLSMTDTRFAVVDRRNRVTRYGNWFKRDGVFYSKDNCFTVGRSSYNSYGGYSGTQGYDYTTDREPFYGLKGWWNEDGKFFYYTVEDEALRATCNLADDMGDYLRPEDYPIENAADLSDPKQRKGLATSQNATAASKAASTATDDIDQDTYMSVREVTDIMVAFVHIPAEELSTEEVYDAIDNIELVRLNVPADWDLPQVMLDALDEYYIAADERAAEEYDAAQGGGGFDMDVGGESAHRMDEYDVDDADGLSEYYGKPLGMMAPPIPSIGELCAVYGTLKRGHGNHQAHLGGELSEFIGCGTTDLKLRMEDCGIPYVYEGDHEAGHNIKVEVSRVMTYEAWEGLDQLEGTPWHYDRKLTDITLADGTSVNAWMYYAVAAAPPSCKTTWIDNYRLRSHGAWKWEDEVEEDKGWEQLTAENDAALARAAAAATPKGGKTIVPFNKETKTTV